MNWLIIPILIWIMALSIMILPKFACKKIQKLKMELVLESELAQNSNPEESNYKKIEENTLDGINIESLYLISSIIASILIVLGTFILYLVLLL
ncbi:hypothetical protein HPB58_09670 [Priestia filamentosa]|uniref:hypothetical protein n=1 Tax=Priestia filamentosa TaxID=1402861 RepID=UPI001FB24D36|nr:hypothetical protein [Priestia filamentosa]UOE62421.1 hypothetical protein HPB58_09670 [Priestia filamentosa]